MPEWLKEMSAVEWLAALTTLINVWLTVKARLLNYAFGVVAVLLYAWVFWTNKLYANCGLQVLYYLPMQFYGWWVWLRTGPDKSDDLPIGKQTTEQRILGAFVTFWGTAAVAAWMKRIGDPQPVADAFTTVASIVGQYLLTRKVLENWLYWIAADLVFIFWLFPQQKLWVSTGLYVLLLIMSVMGLIQWLKANEKGAVHA